MTENQAVSAILNGVTAYEAVTSTSLHEDQVAAELDTLRCRLVDDVDKAGMFRRPFNNYTQNIEFDVKRRTDQSAYIETPRIHSLRGNVPAIAYIGSISINKPQPFRVMSGSQWVNAEHDLFVKKIPIAVYNQETIELKNTSAKKIRLVAVFEDPSALGPFGYDDTVQDYPMPAGMLDIAIGKMTESYIRQLYRVPVQANKEADAPQQV